jgi:hypothetical protein
LQIISKIKIATTKNVELKYNRFIKTLLVRVGKESYFTKIKVEYGGETYERGREIIQK